MKYAVPLLLIGLLSGPVCAQTQEKSPWAFGLGVGSQILADYRGSSFYQAKVLPIPFVLYQGKILKMDREGVRGDILQTSRLEFSLSVDAAFNGDGDNNPLRSGMPSLNNALEVGPSLNIRLTGEDLRAGWSFRIPLRNALGFSSSQVENIGFLASPRLVWRQSVEKDQWQTSFQLGVQWASADYHDYYYGVAPEYATPSRPPFTAESGYSGAFLRTSLKRQWGQWWLAGNLRLDYLEGTQFTRSPLVEESSSATLSFAVVRLL